VSAALPIVAALPALEAALRDSANMVLIAPPGAGKTTMVAPALLDQPWCTGRILLLSPRRIAARAAAERMADLARTRVGDAIGYATRMDSRLSAASRIVVMTEGIFVNRIQADPELDGVSAVLFDEVHERSLDSDFGLALALEAQAAFRPDLRLVAMSATLDGARFADLLGQGGDAAAPTIESEGRSHPLELHHLGRRPGERIEDAMAAAIRHALAEAEGDLLGFLPGAAEINRTAERLAVLGDALAILPLHGALPPMAQRQVLRPDPQGRRKVILATNIAETSLTIDGVRVVVDSGLTRRARFDPAAGVTRLVTERVSQAAATQRAGRAARQGPGRCYRLWEAAATGGLPRFDPPEILESDLAPLLLQCAAWGESDPRRLRWLDPPPAPALAEARRRLQAIGALDPGGAISAHGRAVAALPLPPHLAHMLCYAAEQGVADRAAALAVLLQERGLGGGGEDLAQRLAHWQRDRSDRADKARRLARRWADAARAAVGSGAGDDDPETFPPGILLAQAFPDWIARRRDASGEHWASSGGRRFRLDPASPLAGAPWLAIGAVQGSAADARILAALPLDEAAIEQHFSDRIARESVLRYNAEARRVEARFETRLGAIRLASGPDPAPDADAVAAALLDAVRRHGLDLLDWGEGGSALRQRAAFAGIAALSDAALLADLEDWLAPLLVGARTLDAATPQRLCDALRGRLGWDLAQQLDRTAPAMFESPAGSRHAIDYAAPAGPTVTLRVQALYGLDAHPLVGADRLPLVLALTSPAGRPIQTTRDLPGFWRGSWQAVAREMRGRYPRHHWPDAPWQAAASLKTKKAQGL